MKISNFNIKIENSSFQIFNDAGGKFRKIWYTISSDDMNLLMSLFPNETENNTNVNIRSWFKEINSEL